MTMTILDLNKGHEVGGNRPGAMGNLLLLSRIVAWSKSWSSARDLSALILDISTARPPTQAMLLLYLPEYSGIVRCWDCFSARELGEVRRQQFDASVQRRLRWFLRNFLCPCCAGSVAGGIPGPSGD